MSATPAATPGVLPADEPRLANPGMVLALGLIAAAASAVGLFIHSSAERVAYSWLVAVVFWTACSIGVLFLVLLHHIFDSGWSTIVRRPLEHWLAAFKWLALLFVPLLAIAWTHPALLWRWMDPTFDLSAIGGHETIGSDVLWHKKLGFLNRRNFTIATAVFYGIWIWLSYRFRKFSFAQDEDGDPNHSLRNRWTAGLGIPLTALSLTFAAFYWVMSLEYHWFSTMYGVWFFSACIRAGIALITLLCIYLVRTGAFRGIFTTAHLLNLGNLGLTFTVFWGYITFAQYFLIWNANVPEETFWYVVRELNLSTGAQNSWWWVGLVLLFGHFFVPFCFFLGHYNKKKTGRMIFICVWILAIHLLDIMYNIMPAMKQAGTGDPMPFGITIWDVTAFVSVGAICFWAFLNSLLRTRVIPIRDPRIIESLHAHE